MGRSSRVIAPALIGMLALGFWEGIVRVEGIPPYILPGPLLVARTVITDWSTLFPSLLVTLASTAETRKATPVMARVTSSEGKRVLQSVITVRAFFPYAVILQVTPLVAIAPLI